MNFFLNKICQNLFDNLEILFADILRIQSQERLKFILYFVLLQTIWIYKQFELLHIFLPHQVIQSLHTSVIDWLLVLFYIILFELLVFIECL